MKREYTKQQILESKQVLNEDWIENALMIAGFVPVIGEIADIILIIRYIYKKEYLYAAIMLISLIPTVGDFIAAPIVRLLKGSGEIAAKTAGGLVKYAESHPEFVAKYVKIGKYLDHPSVLKSIHEIEKIPMVGKTAAQGLEKGILEHKGIVSRLTEKIGGSRIGQMGSYVKSGVQGGKTLSRGIKDYFQGEKLAKYIAKNGKAPETWLSHWWNVVKPARGARRNMFRSFIATNHLLNTLGLPSMDAFEEKFQSDASFRNQLANDPSFSQYVEQSTSPDELGQINQMSTTPSSEGGSGGHSFFGNMIGFGMVKQLAQTL